MKTTGRSSRGAPDGVSTEITPESSFTSDRSDLVTMQEVEDTGPDGETKQCMALWRSVLAQHIRDLGIYGDEISASRQRHKAEAAEWFGFQSKTATGTEGFFEVCELAMVSGEALLNRLSEILAMNLSDAARCFTLHDLAMQINRGPLHDRFRASPDSTSG